MIMIMMIVAAECAFGLEGIKSLLLNSEFISFKLSLYIIRTNVLTTITSFALIPSLINVPVHSARCNTRLNSIRISIKMQPNSVYIQIIMSELIHALNCGKYLKKELFRLVFRVFNVRIRYGTNDFFVIYQIFKNSFFCGVFIKFSVAFS